jgi:hypothetical protein
VAWILFADLRGSLRARRCGLFAEIQARHRRCTLQHIKSFRSGRWPFRRHSRRVGADAAFAKAMARSEFGRFYTDEQEQSEVRRSLDRAKGRRQPEEQKSERKEEIAPVRSKSKPVLWHQPSPRLRRTELAEARARLRRRQS